MFIRNFAPLFATLALAVAIAACDSPQSPDPQQDTATATDAPDTATENAAAENETTEEPALAEVAETEGLDNTTDDTAADIRLPAAEAVATTAPEWRYREGEHFRRMTASQGTSSPPDKIEVAEVFWYGCSHCYNFEPIVEQWREQLADDVAFVRIPVIWNPTNKIHARIMYTAEALDVLDKVHPEVFRAIHQQGEMLTEEAKIVALFEKFGIEEARFRDAYDSFGVNSAVKRAENLTARYGVRSVPVTVVNGKYATDAPQIRTFDDMLSVTSELVERERQAL